MKNFLKSPGFKILVAVAAFLMGVFIYSAATGGVATLPEQLFGAILAPIQSATSGVTNGVGDFFSGITSGSSLKAENEALKAENKALRDQLTDYDEMKRRYDQLLAFMELKEENPDYQFAEGRVIARDPEDKYGNFTIDTGSLSNVKTGDPVIAAEGLVGVVSEVGLTWAKVSTILDVETHVSAYISRSGDAGITGGTLELAQRGQLRLNNLDRDAGVLTGDIVVTYGGSSQYPAKLQIGTVKEVMADSDGLSMYALVEPFVSVDAVTDVLVITDFSGKITDTE